MIIPQYHYRLHVVPKGVYDLLKWLSKRYENPLIIITENGVNLPSDRTLSKEEAISDDFRIKYLSGN